MVQVGKLGPHGHMCWLSLVAIKGCRTTLHIGATAAFIYTQKQRN